MRSYQRVLVVFGTRPEAIKMAPVIKELRNSSSFDLRVCVTGQHRQMLDQVLWLFGIKPDFDLDLMMPAQTLAGVAARILAAMQEVYRQWRPDLLVVQGDTTTTFAASLSAFYDHIPVAHIEAGLRTGNPYSPWPEEVNRRLTSLICAHHFAPTARARQNLIAEGVSPESVLVTGNTVIDALRLVLSQIEEDSPLRERLQGNFGWLVQNRRLVLVTGHRRENFGDSFRNICIALRELAKRQDLTLLYPVHFNPNVQRPVYEILGGVENIHLVAPLEYCSFSYLLKNCYMTITDSGGIQEEATYLGKPVLLMRDTTERPEAVDAGTVRLVGTDVETILQQAHCLLDHEPSYRAMARPSNQFGDGFAARRIVEHLQAYKGAQVATVC